MVNLLVILQSVSLLICVIAFFITYTSFKNFYGGLGNTILVSYGFFVLYNIMEVFILTRNNPDFAILVSRISSAILGVGIYLLHYFHDELSAVYRIRKTMTVSSVLLGLIIGTAWFEGAVNINQDIGAPYVHPLYGALLLLLGGFAIHRITSHLITMSKLSDHYKIKSTISTNVRNWVQRLILFVLVVSIFLMFFIEEIISLPFGMIISFSVLILAILYKLDPISSIPIAQQIQAVALINNENVKYLYVFSEQSSEIVSRNDFASLLTNLGSMFGDIMQSKSEINSMSTGDVFLLFESCGDDYLVLILEKRAPFVRRILKALAKRINEIPLDNQVSFSQTVEKYLLYPSDI